MTAIIVGVLKGAAAGEGAMRTAMQGLRSHTVLWLGLHLVEVWFVYNLGG
ncbi:uncharacterized protein G2W53_029239 [Senna tora]|uniref:Uncharacterized protein n=1 Tax=Senna tora TaxID=362788 RepID=A0A834W9H0_9FABA|nr:uncharacterized protein G2W53_029239 [Senna tora]